MTSGESICSIERRNHRAGFTVSKLNCHPERSEGPAVSHSVKKRVFRFAQDHN
jgi:hypothetical protein